MGQSNSRDACGHGKMKYFYSQIGHCGGNLPPCMPEVKPAWYQTMTEAHNAFNPAMKIHDTTQQNGKGNVSTCKKSFYDIYNTFYSNNNNWKQFFDKLGFMVTPPPSEIGPKKNYYYDNSYNIGAENNPWMYVPDTGKILGYTQIGGVAITPNNWNTNDRAKSGYYKHGCDKYYYTSTRGRNATNATYYKFAGNQIFFFKNVSDAQKYGKNGAWIGVTTYKGATYYYYPDPSNVVIANGGISMDDIIDSSNNNVSSITPSFISAVEACNDLSNNIDNYGNNLVDGNKGFYENALNNVRTTYGLIEKETNNLYTAEFLPQTPPNLCYFSPNQTEYYNTGNADNYFFSSDVDDYLYMYSPELLETAKLQCNNLNQTLLNEAKACCINGNSIAAAPSGTKCPDTISNIPKFGCNMNTTLLDVNNNYAVGNSIANCNSDNYTKNKSICTIPNTITEGFDNQWNNYPELKQTLEKINNTSNNLANNLNKVQKAINTPSSVAAFGNVKDDYNAQSLNNVNSNLSKAINNMEYNMIFATGGAPATSNSKAIPGYKSTPNLTYNELTADVSNALTYNETSVNNCNNPKSIMAYNDQNQYYLSSGGPGCINYQNLYQNTLTTCDYVVQEAKNFSLNPKDVVDINNIDRDMKHGLIGRTLSDTENVLGGLNKRCYNWYVEFQKWIDDEDRAAAIPCEPTRPTTNGFDKEAQSIVDKWNAEAGAYLEQLIKRLNTINDYVEKYPNNINVKYNVVPNGTPNTPFAMLNPSNNGATGPASYEMEMYIPSGPQGPKGENGARGPNGPNGLMGPTGATGPAGISEIPNQYIPYLQ